MTKIAAVADLHIQDGGQVTLDEQIKVLKQIVPADYLVMAGDTFDSASSPASRMAAIEIYSYWAEHAPVIVVKGNDAHDRPGDIAFLSKLRTKHPIHVCESFGFVEFPNMLFVCMAFPSRGRIAAWLPEADHLKVDAAGQGALSALFAGAAVRVKECGKPAVFVGHVELGSAKIDNGQPVAGHADLPIGEHDLLEIGAEAICLGHIHLRQILSEKIVYSGSPRAMSFGENGQHGYVLWEGSPLTPKFVDIDSPQFVTVEVPWSNGVLHLKGVNPPAGAHVRLCYSVPESDRAQAFEAAQLWAAQFKHCKIDPTVITDAHVRSQTIKTARTPADKLAAWWESKEKPARSTEILAKLDEVMS